MLEMRSRGLDLVGGQGLYGEQCDSLWIDECEEGARTVWAGWQVNPIVITLKRGIDICGSLLSFIILVPLLFLIAVFIKCDSPGPVLYRQLRIGRLGVPFVLLKFRSMYQNAERQGIQWADISDCRVTKVGRWLRKSRLDELPQLWNVLQGDMSLIGPRPERPHFVKDLRAVIPLYDFRHTIRPGITGWAQTCFQYAASLDDSSH